MSAATGLGPLELAALATVDRLGAGPRGEPAPSGAVLAALERDHGLGARYAYPMLADLTAPWRLHLPLLDPVGNFGSVHGDPPASPRYTAVRLSEVGAMALAAERGRLGPVPLGLIEGSLYRDGAVPPFGPAAVVAALRSGAARPQAGPPVLPGGGTVSGDVAALLAGRPVRLRLGCAVRAEPGRLVLTAVPLGVTLEQVLVGLRQRLSAGPGPGPVPAPPPVTDALDETSARTGVRVVCRLAAGADPAAARAWLEQVWPVTVEVDAALPAPMPSRLAGWSAGDGTGLAALAALL